MTMGQKLNHITSNHNRDDSSSTPQQVHRPLHRRGRSLTLFGSGGGRKTSTTTTKLHSSSQPSPPLPSEQNDNNCNGCQVIELPPPKPFPTLSLSPARNRSRQSQSKTIRQHHHHQKQVISSSQSPRPPKSKTITTIMSATTSESSSIQNQNKLHRPTHYTLLRSPSSTISGIPASSSSTTTMFKRSLRYLFIVTVLAVLVVIFMLHHQIFIHPYTNSDYDNNYQSSAAATLPTHSYTARNGATFRENGGYYSFGDLTSTFLSSSKSTKEWDIRSRERRKRTRPPSSSQSSLSLETVVYQSYSFSNESAETTILSTTKSKPTKASSSICGTLAKKSPYKFSPHSQDLLNESSRVVITGILNQIGFHLALTLHTECNVQYIFGIDTFAPQTMKHRMDAIQRYRLLKKHIPTLQNVVIPYVGIHPKQKINNSKKTPHNQSQQKNNSIELLAAIQPTHIVHLSEYSEEYQYTLDKELHQAQELSMTSHLLSPIPPSLYTLRNAAISMEQILNELHRPPFVGGDMTDDDASDKVTAITNGKTSSSSSTTKSLPPHFSFATTMTKPMSNLPKTYYDIARSIELSLQSSYQSLYGTFAMGLALPCTYGPFGHRDSLSVKLGQSTIFQQQQQSDGGDKNVTVSTPMQVLEELTKQQLKSEDDYAPLCDDYLYVEEVVDAIILGMQYRNPYDKFEIIDTVKTIKQVVKDHQPRDSPKEKGGSKHSKALSSTKSPTYLGPLTPKELAKAMVDYYSFDDAQGEKIYESLKSTSSLLKHTDSLLQDYARKQLAWQYTEMVPLDSKTAPPRPVNLFHQKEEANLGRGRKHLKKGQDDINADNQLSQNPHYLPDSLPCASECSYEDRCVPSFWDDAVKVSRTFTRSKDKCQIVLYMVNLWPDVTHLNQTSAPSDNPEMEELVCKIAFVSFESDLVQNALSREAASSGALPKKSSTNNMYSPDSHRVAAFNGQLVVHNWTLVWVHGGDASKLTEAEYSLAKLAPGSLFSTRISQAMFVHPDSFVVPSTDRVLSMLSMVHQPARKARRANFGKPPVPAKKGRHPILLGPEFDVANVGLKPSSRATLYAKYLCDISGITMSKGLAARAEVYEKIQDSVRKLRNQFGEARTPYGEFPFHWMRTLWVFHDFRTPMAKELRCDWYKEQTFWNMGNSEMDDLSLAYVLATRSMEGTLGGPLEDDGTWLPVLDPDAPEYEKEMGENIVNHKGVEMYVRIFTRTKKNDEKKDD